MIWCDAQGQRQFTWWLVIEFRCLLLADCQLEWNTAVRLHLHCCSRRLVSVAPQPITIDEQNIAEKESQGKKKSRKSKKKGGQEKEREHRRRLLFCAAIAGVTGLVSLPILKGPPLFYDWIWFSKVGARFWISHLGGCRPKGGHSLGGGGVDWGWEAGGGGGGGGRCGGTWLVRRVGVLIAPTMTFPIEIAFFFLALYRKREGVRCEGARVEWGWGGGGLWQSTVWRYRRQRKENEFPRRSFRQLQVSVSFSRFEWIFGRSPGLVDLFCCVGLVCFFFCRFDLDFSCKWYLVLGTWCCTSVDGFVVLFFLKVQVLFSQNAFSDTPNVVF